MSQAPTIARAFIRPTENLGLLSQRHGFKNDRRIESWVGQPQQVTGKYNQRSPGRQPAIWLFLWFRWLHSKTVFP